MKLQGGPADGRETEGDAQMVMVPLDALMRPTSGQPAAFAVYREAAGVFVFQGIEVPFIDGPMEGERTPPQPGKIRVALDSQMQVKKNLDDPAAVAIYERWPSGYHLLRIE